MTKAERAHADLMQKELPELHSLRKHLVPKHLAEADFW